MFDPFRFCSDQFSDGRAFPEYVELYSNASEVRRGAGPFRADVRAWRLDEMLVFERRLTGVIHERSERGAVEHPGRFFATLVLSGRVDVSPAGRLSSVLAGCIYLTDTRRASRTEYLEAHVVTVAVSREVMEAGAGACGGLHGRVLTAPSNLMLADFFRSLARHGDSLERSALPGLRGVLIELLSATEGLGDRSGADSRRQDYRRRDAVERIIKARLGDRRLSVVSISADTAVSRSALYRLFEDHGGIARLITRRRLEAMRQAVDDCSPDDPGTLARTYGFSDERQMKQLFSQAYGVSLGAYRAHVAAAGDDVLADTRRRWQAWMTEIS